MAFFGFFLAFFWLFFGFSTFFLGRQGHKKYFSEEKVLKVPHPKRPKMGLKGHNKRPQQQFASAPRSGMPDRALFVNPLSPIPLRNIYVP